MNRLEAISTVVPEPPSQNACVYPLPTSEQNPNASSSTSRWSLKLIFTVVEVLMRATKPVNMSFKLQREVVEPAHGFGSGVGGGSLINVTPCSKHDP